MARREMLAAAILAAVLLVPASAQQQPAPKEGLKIAVLNLRECFKGERYEWVKEIDAELQTFAEQLAADQKSIEDKLREVNEKVVTIPKGTSLYYELLMEKQVLETKRESQEKIGRVRYLNTYRELKFKVYNEILRVAEIVGKDRGFDLILRAEEPLLEEDQEGIERSITSQMNRRVVLFYNDTVDITGEVLVKLNAEYKIRKARGNGGGAGAGETFCPTCQMKTATEAPDKCVRCGKAKKEE